MKTSILIGAVALAIGATAWRNNNMSISDIIGSKSIGLQCQMKDDVTTLSQGSDPRHEGGPYTEVIELNGSTWPLVTVDGHPWKEDMEHLAKMDGKTLEAGAMNIPLRVTAEAYVLFEPEETDQGSYRTIKRGFYIDRIKRIGDRRSQLGRKKRRLQPHYNNHWQMLANRHPSEPLSAP